MLIHLDGKLVPRDQARVDPFDRGFLFGDGLYEGLRAFDGHVVGMARHVERLRLGLAEARIPWDAGEMVARTHELLSANQQRDAFIYWQVTRGVPAPGEPLRARVPTGDVRPTVFGYSLPASALSSYTEPPTKSAVTVRDTRWLRGRVKSISLLGNVIASIEADEGGADDAILVRDGLVAEGSSANLVAVVPDGDEGWEVVTPSLDSTPMLAGVTRDLILGACGTRRSDRTESNENGTKAGPLHIIERALTADELRRASEVMLLGTLTMVTSITRLDGRSVGDGSAGPVARSLLQTLLGVIRAEQQAAHGTTDAAPAMVMAVPVSHTARGGWASSTARK